jgi:hypothetical protein
MESFVGARHAVTQLAQTWSVQLQFRYLRSIVTKDLPKLNREHWTNTLSKGLVTFRNGH